MATNREQAEKVIEQYVKRNTPKKGKNKGMTPTWAELMDFVSECVSIFSIDYNMVLSRKGEEVTIEEILNTVLSRSAQVVSERIEELKEQGVEVNVIDVEERDSRDNVDSEEPVDVDFEVVEDE